MKASFRLGLVEIGQPFLKTLSMHTTDINVPRTCLSCGKVLKGRIDKKFCDDQCRNLYNNRPEVKTEAVKLINAILKRNWTILKEVMADEKVIKVERYELERRDFNFCYYTHLNKDKQGVIYNWYEYGIRTHKDICMIVKNS